MTEFLRVMLRAELSLRMGEGSIQAKLDLTQYKIRLPIPSSKSYILSNIHTFGHQCWWEDFWRRGLFDGKVCSSHFFNIITILFS